MTNPVPDARPVSLAPGVISCPKKAMKIRDKESEDQPWIEQLLNERWGGEGRVIAHGEVFDARLLPALVAGEQRGLATYQVRRSNDIVFAELVTLDTVTINGGIGTALIEALVSRLRAKGVKVLRVTTTNDNLDALRFYQRRGFRIIAVRPGAVDESRRIKPSIPVTGEYGIPIRDEIELEREIQHAGEIPEEDFEQNETARHSCDQTLNRATANGRE
jgi:GNAT superfamily N-acetyltransferase